jgi:hypothetical protein
MTPDEVEAILGKGTDITHKPYAQQWAAAQRRGGAQSVQLVRWGDDKYWTRVGFVDGKAVYIGRSVPPSEK